MAINTEVIRFRPLGKVLLYLLITTAFSLGGDMFIYSMLDQGLNYFGWGIPDWFIFTVGVVGAVLVPATYAGYRSQSERWLALRNNDAVRILAYASASAMCLGSILYYLLRVNNQLSIFR